MRSRNSKIARTIASVLMSLLFLTAVSPAATKPISAVLRRNHVPLKRRVVPANIHDVTHPRCPQL
jgi:hypothetical protein